MSIISLTGSETNRFNDIQETWLVFEPTSNEDFDSSELYTTPLGQNVEPDLIIFSSSQSNSGSFTITKEIHKFNNEEEAGKFINEAGAENVLSVRRRKRTNLLTGTRDQIVVQVMDISGLEFNMQLLNLINKDGYKIEVFRSSSVDDGGVQRISRNRKFDLRGNLISDTYEKFFKIKTD